MKKVFGIGVNDVPGLAGTPLYCVWQSMLRRAYDPKMHAKCPTYKNCTVCHEWHTLSRFLEWVKSRWAPGLCLDKDILVPGNKCYGPGFCVFVTQAVNKLLSDCGRARGRYPRGVSLYHGKFGARLKANRKWVYLGVFDTPEEAYRAYVQAKAAEIRRVGGLQDNPLVRDGLEKHALILEGSVG